MDVDLVINDQLGEAEAQAVVAEFRGLGLTPTARFMPTRRGEELTWLVLATLPLSAFLTTLGSKFAEDAYQRLHSLVRGVLAGRKTTTGGRLEIILQDLETGTHVVLEAELPPEACRELLRSDLVATAGRTLHYDARKATWVAS